MTYGEPVLELDKSCTLWTSEVAAWQVAIIAYKSWQVILIIGKFFFQALSSEFQFLYYSGPEYPLGQGGL